MIMELFWLEHKKMWRKTSTKISVFLCFAYVVIFGGFLAYQWFSFGSHNPYKSAFGNNFDGYGNIKSSQAYAKEYAGDKIVILSTHIVSDIEAIADEVMLMKKGKIIQQGTVAELTRKAEGKVWELTVSQEEAGKWQANAAVSNLRHEGNKVVLRILSDSIPDERAVPYEASLEDLYLYYFGSEEGLK